jgi:hypothetical protein
MKYMGMTKKALIVERRKILDFLPRQNEAKFTTRLLSLEEVEAELLKIKKKIGIQL